MKLKFIIIYSLLAWNFHFISIAQENFRFGVICGISISKLLTPTNHYQNLFERKVCIYPKVVCSLPLKKRFWFQTEVGLVDNGSSLEYYTDSLYVKHRESRYFIQFTELIGYSLNVNHKKKMKLNIETGPFVGYYLFSHEYWKTENLFDNSETTDKYNRNICKEDPLLRKYIAGISLGTGISKEYRGSTLLIDFRYDLSLTKVSKVPDDPEFPGINRIYYQLFSLSLGYLFGGDRW